MYLMLNTLENERAVYLFMFMMGGFFILVAYGGMHQSLKSGKLSNKLWEISTILGFFVVGFLGVGTVQIFTRIQRLRDSPGILLDNIRRAEFILLEEPTPLRKNSWIANAYLLKTYAESITADARGRITVIGHTPWEDLGLGRVLTTSGRFSQGDEDLTTWYAKTLLDGKWQLKLAGERHRLIRFLSRKLMAGSHDTYTFLYALILGMRIDSGSRIIRNFREAGSMHLLALSGFHVGIIAIAVQRITKILLGLRQSIIVSLILVVFYLLLVGYRPSLMRAVLMYGLWVRDRYRGYRVLPMNYLCTAFVVQTILFPYSVTSLSFILSYAALGGILSGGLSLSRIIGRYLPIRIAYIIGISLGAQCATMPIVMGVFGVWRPVAIISATILTPFVVLSMALGTMLMMIPAGRITAFIASFMNILIEWMAEIAGICAQVPALRLGLILPWLLMVAGTILPTLYTRDNHAVEPQLPSLNPKIPDIERHCTKKTLGPEFPD